MEDFRYFAYAGSAMWLEVVEITSENKYLAGQGICAGECSQAVGASRSSHLVATVRPGRSVTKNLSNL
jgi:hypothetical protein